MFSLNYIKARRLIKWRRASQILFFGIFVSLLWGRLVALPLFHGSTSLFFQTDPFWSVIKIFSGSAQAIFFLAAIPLVLTLFLGRFFCGWICPMGTLNQFFMWIFSKTKTQRIATNSQLQLKYLILFGTGILALLGLNLAGWLDPFSFLTRGLSGGLLSGLLLMTILILNAKYKRFFCAVLCPLGALYGLTSRLGFLRINRSADCTDCGLCNKDCSYDMNALGAFHPAECTTCLNCLGHCKKDIAQVTWENPIKPVSKTYAPGRRLALTTLGGTLAFAGLAKVSAPFTGSKRTPYLRPPGSLKEDDFTDECMRCGNCIAACPPKIIQHSYTEAGWEGLWTPILNFEFAGCAWECVSCLDVCPTSAIEQLTLPQKQEYRIGTAIIKKDFCYTYADGFNCTACIEACPTPEKALFTRPTETWNYRGQKVTVNQVIVDPDLCIGCGLCIPACPRKDEPAVIVRFDS